MSLISEALKKARQEAARQDAQRPRSPYAVGVADSTARRPGLVMVLAGVGAGCLVAAAILAIAWSAGWGPFARSAKPAAQVAAEAPAMPAPVKPASEPAAVPPAMIEEQAPPTPVQSASPEPPPVQENRPLAIEARPSAPAEASAAHPAPTPPAPAAAEENRVPAAASPSPPAPAAAAPSVPAASTPPRPSPSPSAGGLVDGQTYTGEVPVPGGGTVRLNGIVFSQEQPVAMLDGRVMAPGEIIQGFTIAAIEAGRVKLQGYGATVFVSPR